MAEGISLAAIAIYLETHPLIAVLLVVLAVMFLGSLLRKLINPVRLAVTKSTAIELSS